MTKWADNPDNCCIFWLSGRAGTGKSTIARTVARAFNYEKRLGASFFFSRDQKDRDVADKFFTSIAAQLTNLSPILKSNVYQAIEKPPPITQRSMREQWEQLIFQPLSALGASSETSLTIAIVIDALDECGGLER